MASFRLVLGAILLSCFCCMCLGSKALSGFDVGDFQFGHPSLKWNENNEFELIASEDIEFLEISEAVAASLHDGPSPRKLSCSCKFAKDGATTYSFKETLAEPAGSSSDNTDSTTPNREHGYSLNENSPRFVSTGASRDAAAPTIVVSTPEAATTPSAVQFSRPAAAQTASFAPVSAQVVDRVTTRDVEPSRNADSFERSAPAARYVVRDLPRFREDVVDARDSHTRWPSAEEERQVLEDEERRLQARRAALLHEEEEQLEDDRLRAEQRMPLRRIDSMDTPRFYEERPLEPQYARLPSAMEDYRVNRDRVELDQLEAERESIANRRNRVESLLREESILESDLRARKRY
eukprot:GILK01000816.1.p1 GENE.GILK01000816.1~~GILK01000816.1.p1  ORF type:complete len:365 (+),score=71.77 GILK01000816.1:48-1097(+)